MNEQKKYSFEHAKRIAVKVGSGVLTQDHGLNRGAVKSISMQISTLIDKGLEVILVSSGAMACGVKKIGLSKRPDEIPKRQAVAAVGQTGLMNEYENAFGKTGKKVAQILLIRSDLCDRKRYLNARNTINTLLSWGIVPVIIENDTVAVEEIQFGDNDNLSAMITILMDADILINLTDIDGLYTKDPRKYPDAELIPKVAVIDKKVEKFASNIPGALGTGGMLSKIKAASKVCGSGIPMVIANGEIHDILTRIISGEKQGTFFIPKKERLSGRKSWIAFTLKPQGVIKIDDGAALALLNKGKSLLPSGVTEVEGKFDTGAAVQFTDLKKNVRGVGLVNYSASDIRKIKGLRSNQIKKRIGQKPYDEVIHRDNLVVTGKQE
jgi:glutamate 5-kinase